ncbi:predicted protein [Phaeodactylum tricornutum CCAP 1055/1]|uniref:Uncharacterized protein n=3 Tax=Phaeodactylum tricornutum TaxID=2850 RepID=B7FPP1_PHATC|nr:predicted protein [Phaeodactylum tricornutum CCAP 1055/1]EEC51210.1 predicted protein [Phaeodactylum tricornutum CCAP 1055/1]|eukprot:XP_002176747.1 predicted protein [Phaeodactylum tricornutum CCAP 1055/1]
MGVMEKIKEIEAEMARTQKNKATNSHLGLLKAKLARLRNELFVEQSGGGGGGGEGFDVARNGDARIALIGFPSVGKSSLLNSLTTTESEAAGYEFTTLTCIPGVLRYKGSKMQVLDLPGIIEGAAHGAGRGREVIAVARSADAILIVLDAGKEGLQKHREILERELETVGIRLNQRAPDVTLTKRKAGGGVRFASTVPQPLLGVEPEKLVTQILREYRITSADILAREEITVDQLVDVIQGNREYKPCLYLYNKIDTVTVEEVDQLARMPYSIVGSVAQGFNISGPFEDDRLKQMMWDYLGLTRVYTKRKGSPPDVDEPVVLSEIRKGTTVKSLCSNVSSELLRDFNYALVWGTSAKHAPQRCGLNHILDDEDVVQIVSKTPHSKPARVADRNRMATSHLTDAKPAP